MSEVINCPSCKRKLQVPETLIGQDVQCPTCSATFVARIGDTNVPMQQAPEQISPRRWEDDRSRDRDEPMYGGRPYGDGYDDDSMRRRRDLAPHRGTMILVLGILGISVCGILAPIAWILGNTDIAEIRAGRMDPEGEGMTQAGRVCGMIGTAFIALALCGYGIIFLSVLGGGRF